jgi:hypothetical protein
VRRLARDEAPRHGTKRVVTYEPVDHRKLHDQSLKWACGNPSDKAFSRTPTPAEPIGYRRERTRPEAPRSMVDVCERGHLLSPSADQRARRRTRLAWTVRVASARSSSPTKIGNGGTSLSHSVRIGLPPASMRARIDRISESACVAGRVAGSKDLRM